MNKEQEANQGHQIIKLIQELQEMPEYHLYTELLSLNNSIYIFDANFVELHDLVVHLTAKENAQSLWWVRNRSKLRNASQEIVRRIHNFVASALSLIDHTRRIYNKLYGKAGVFPEYQERVHKEFIDDELAQFVKDLRQYCQHYKLPAINFTAHVDKLQDGLTTTINLLVRELASYDGWSSKAKEYLGKAKDRIDVLRVATEYREKVIAFYEWFQNRQGAIHADEFKHFKDKENELLVLQLEDKLDFWLNNQEYRKSHGRADEIFTEIFHSDDFDELEQITDLNIRAKRVIEKLKRRLNLSEAIITKIYRAYTLDG